MRLFGPAAMVWIAALSWLLKCGRAGSNDTATQDVLVPVYSGQELADHITSFGQQGGNYTLLIMADSLDMRGVEFWTSNNSIPGRFSSGTLIIRGHPRSGALHTVVDAGMRAALTPPFTGDARLYLQKLIVVNSCSMMQELNSAGLSYPTAYTVPLFTRNTLYASVYLSNFTAYSVPADLASTLYVWLMKGVTNQLMPDLAERVAPLVSLSTGTTVTNYALNTHAYYVEDTETPDSVWKNTTLMTINNPDDEIIKQLRSNGTLMPPQFCNGTVLSSDIANADVYPSTGPLYLSSTPEDFVTSIHKAAALSGQQEITNGPPPTLLHANIADFSSLYFPEPVNVLGDIILVGVKSRLTVPVDPPPAILDFSNRSGFIQLTNNLANLAFANVIIKGLARAPPPSYPGLQSPVLPSALPLSAIRSVTGSEAWSSNQPIWLWSCHVVLPLPDYLAILYLTLRSTAINLQPCVPPDNIALANQLSAGITNLSTYWIHPEMAYIALRNFTGLGINGGRVRFLPDLPVPPDVVDACVAAYRTALAERSDDGSASQRAGILAGSLIGAAVLLVIGLILGLSWRKRRVTSVAAGRSKTSSSKTLSETCQVLVGLSDAPSQASSQGRSLHGTTTTNNLPTPGSSSDRLTATTITNTRPLWQLVHKNESLMCARAGCAMPNDRKSILYSLPVTDHSPEGPPEMVTRRQSAMMCEIEDYDVLQDFQQTYGEQDIVMMSALPVHTAVDNLHAGIASNPASLVDRHKREALKSRDGDKVVIKNVLGTGAWGTVYTGEWRGVPVAVKTMVFTWSGVGSILSGQPKREARAIMEAAIAASVGHPNLVATYCYDIKPMGTGKSASNRNSLQIEEMFGGFDSRGGAASNDAFKEYKMYLVQELCGCTLGDAIAAGVLQRNHPSNGTCPHMVSVLTLLVDVARGLVYLHGKGIVHGDLKPDNILLQTNNEAPLGIIAKLSDFGLSTPVTEGRTHVSNWACGTPYYCAVEVIRHFQMSPASDMYSFGVIMWELWTGRSPCLVNETNGQMGWDPDFGLFSHPSPPPEYTALFERCLSEDHRSRPTAIDALQLLSELLRTHSNKSKHQPGPTHQSNDEMYNRPAKNP